VPPTWHDLTVAGEATTFTATVPAAGSGTEYIGLRATVGDQAGNRVKQTVLRAYRLR
jgi:hypothetical protein